MMYAEKMFYGKHALYHCKIPLHIPHRVSLCPTTLLLLAAVWKDAHFIQTAMREQTVRCESKAYMMYITKVFMTDTFEVEEILTTLKCRKCGG